MTPDRGLTAKSALRADSVGNLTTGEETQVLSASNSAPSGVGVQLLLLTIATTAGAYSRTAVSPLQESMRIALALSDNQMALLQGPALALPLVIAAIPLGLLIDRYSRVRLLLIFAVCDVAGTVLTALTSKFALLFLVRCVIGLTATTTATAAFSLLADLCVPARRGRASMMMVIGQFAGLAIAFALGGVLVALFAPTSNGWRSAMLWLAGPLVPVVFLMLVMREPPRTGMKIQNSSAQGAFVELWTYRAVITPLLAGLVTAEIAVGSILVWAAPALSRRFVLSPDRIGAIMSTVVLVSGVLGSIAGGVLADYCQRVGGPRRTISVLSGLSLMSVPAGLFGVMPDVTSSSVLLVLFMTVVGAILVMAVAVFTIVIPNELRGLCLAAMTGANILFGTALAPVTVSLLSGAIGGPAKIGRALALVCMLAGVLGAITFRFGRRYFPRMAMQ